MSAWTPERLTAVGGAEELQISSRRRDGSIRPPITIWVVRVGDELFVRSAYGVDNPWFRRAKASGSGRIVAGGVEADVDFAFVDETDAALQAEIDAAYHAKYDRYGPAIVGTVVDGHSWRTTIRLVALD